MILYRVAAAVGDHRICKGSERLGTSDLKVEAKDYSTKS